MLTTLLAALGGAAMAILGRLVSARLAEPVLTALIVWGLPKVAKFTSNTLDDELCAIVIEAIGTKPAEPE